MPERVAGETVPLRLVYSAPQLAQPGTPPLAEDCYNPFPELNDPAPDGVPSVFPMRAKYSLALDTQYLPSSIAVPRAELTEARLATLTPARRGIVAAWLAGTEGPMRIPVPREPALEEAFGFEGNFELAHQRLAATDYKWAFRTFLLAPFYTTFEDALRARRRIRVPLRADPGGTPLQRRWAAVQEWFAPTQVVDEVISLLVCLALNADHAWAGRERAWAEQESEEVRGFAEAYRAVRDQFAPEFRSVLWSNDTAARRRLAEALIQYGRDMLSEAHGAPFPPHNEPIPDDMPVPRRAVRRPPLVGGHADAGRKGLIVHPEITDHTNITSGTASMAEVAQQCQALLVRDDERGKSFLRRDELWPLYASFEREEGGNVAPVRMRASANLHLVAALMMGIRGRDGARLAATTGVWIGDYVLFLEAVRQQICTGIGLRCPFWDGERCCRFRPLLERVSELAGPRAGWPHWQPAPCLG